MTPLTITPPFPLILIILVSICHHHHHDRVEAYGFELRGSVSHYIPIHHYHRNRQDRVGRLRRQSPSALALRQLNDNDDGNDTVADPAQLPILETETKQIRLSSSTPLAEITTCLPTAAHTTRRRTTGTKPPPPLIFIHGSFHASWCWAEHYLPHFASAGYPCYALSLRGTGGTSAGEGVTRVKIKDHVEDVAAFVRYVARVERVRVGDGCGGGGEVVGVDPVLVGHSFGGLTLMKYAESCLLLLPEEGDGDRSASTTAALPPPPSISGMALLCSVPPSGNGKMTLRFLKRSLVDSYRITVGLAARKCITDAKLCRTLFFNGQKRRREMTGNNGGDVDGDDDGGDAKAEDDFGVSDLDLKRYQGYFQRDTVATIDLADLSKKLPSAHVVSAKNDDDYGRAIFADRLPPTLVVGAKHDFIVDREGVEETARYFGVDGPVTMVDSPHDVMLGRNWREGAGVLMGWLEQIGM